MMWFYVVMAIGLIVAFVFIFMALTVAARTKERWKEIEQLQKEWEEMKR